jgi:hypothetical protein
VDETKVEWLANRFYKNDYQIDKLMEDIFTSDWFYNEQNIGAKIKSPIELIAGIQRAIPMEIENDETLLVIQRLLGQMLFYPPNVAGWPGGKNWIDSSSLMMRLRLPQLINDTDVLNVRPKTDDDMTGGRDEDDMMEKGKRKGYGKTGKPINANVNWNAYTKNFEKVPRETLLTEVRTSLLQVPSKANTELIKNFADSSSREAFIKTITLQIMSTPEYQLC